LWAEPPRDGQIDRSLGKDHMKRSLAASAAALCAITVATCEPALSWGVKGHTIIGLAAVAHMPPDLPAFMHTRAAKAEIVYLQSEEDRLKIGASQDRAWAREWTTDHYLDVGDDGLIGGVVSLNALPATRDEYIKALSNGPKHVDAYAVGFVPYAILEGYEQVRADFALWRLAPEPEKAERANLTIHDIGVFAHFVGDGSQPLHITVHYNGWGAYADPDGFTKSRTFHADYEDVFVDDHLSENAVSPLVTPAAVLADVPLTEIGRYLAKTNSMVVPLYALAKRGALGPRSPADAQSALIELSAARLAVAASMLDSLIETAWRASATLKEHY
jgi:hypothetical protein